MPSTTSFDFGDVVLVEFLFTNRTGSKTRPAVVVSSPRYNSQRPDLILMPITSKVRSPLPFGETLVTGWQKAGLYTPGSIKPVLLTAERALVIKRLGQLEAQDQAVLETTLSSLIGRR